MSSLVHVQQNETVEKAAPTTPVNQKSELGSEKKVAKLQPNALPSKTISENYIFDKRKTSYGIPSRWIIMIIVSLLNFSNTASWIAYAPVGNYVNAYYGGTTSAWLSPIYMVISIPLGFCGMWIGSIIKIRGSLILAASVNVLGALVRALSGFSFCTESRGTVVIFGQGIAAVTYPFIMYLPSTVSNAYFPQAQRTIATTIGIMAGPFGILMANLFAPMFVRSSKDVPFLNHLLFAICLVVCCCAWIAIISHKPSENSIVKSEEKSYSESMKICFSNSTYLILLVSLGGGIGMFNSLYSKIFEMICPSGHGNYMAGICVVVMISSGIIGSLIVGVIVDKWKCYRQAMIVTMIGAVSSGVALIWVTPIQGLIGTVLLITFSFLLGTFGLAAYPVGLELALEVTFPVAAEVCSGVIVLFGQLFGVLFVMILQMFSEIIREDDSRYSSIQACRTPGNDLNNDPRIFTTAFVIVSTIATIFAVLVCFIRPQYNRSKNEEKNEHQEKVCTKELGKDMEAVQETVDSPSPPII